MSAVLRKKWDDAMRAEFKRLVGLNAFEFVDVVPDGANVVSVQWVFAWKVDKDGNIVKPKARLVARGFSQVRTVDFLKAGSCKGCFSGEGVLSRKAGLSFLSYSQLLFEETAQDVHR